MCACVSLMCTHGAGGVGAAHVEVIQGEAQVVVGEAEWVSLVLDADVVEALAEALRHAELHLRDLHVRTAGRGTDAGWLLHRGRVVLALFAQQSIT